MSKKQIRTLSVLAAVAVLLGVLLGVLRYDPDAKPMEPLVEIPAEEIDQLCFTYRDQPVILQRLEGRWQVLLKNSALPARQDMVEAMVSTLCAVRPQAQLENPDPELMAQATQTTLEILSGSGTEQVTASQQIVIGAMNAITDQLYVQVGEQVYLTDTTILDTLSITYLDLLEQYPIPKPDDQKSVTVENALGTVSLSCAADQTGGEEGTWYLKNGETWVQADQDQAYNFYFLTWDMHWKSTAAVVTGDTDLSQYGLDTPQAVYTLTYGSETFTLYFGKDLPDGTTYAMCQGSPLIYTMDTLLAQWLAQATAATLLPTIS